MKNHDRELAVPADLSALCRQIQEEFPRLSRRLQEVGSYVLDNPQMIAFDTAAEIARVAGVHGSTLVRFAHRFGFSGFSGMQQLFKDQQISQLPDYSKRIRLIQTGLGDDDAVTAPHLLDEFTTANIMSLKHLHNQIDPAKLTHAIELMDRAANIYICGVRRAFPVSMYFTYALSHIQVRCHAVDGLGCMSLERVQYMEADDLLIIITFRPYSRITLDAMAIAVARGARIVVITDSEVSPVIAHADVGFVVRDAEVRTFRSLNSTLCLAQTMCIALGFRRESHNTPQP